MNKKIARIFILFLLGNSTIHAQQQSTREMFLEAESYFLYEEYNEALPLYIQLSQMFPNNDNIKYRLGRCYLNIPFEKIKAIQFLEKASKNISPKQKGDNLKINAAPVDAVFYLGDAYRVNNDIEKAIEQYNQFKLISSPHIFDHQLVNDYIKTCETARLFEQQPLNISFTNLGEPINTRFSENNAVVSGDESILVFSAQLRFYTPVFYSYKVNGKWSIPENINPDLGVDDDCFPVGISHDGKELLLYRNNEYLGDLFVSRLVNGKWSKIQKLNNNINTKFWESHACLSSDGTRLYFTSNRKGGFGGLDIYVSIRTDVTLDQWGEAINLGPVVNSSLNEETPFILADNSKLFFSSLGHNSMGGYDIFVSQDDRAGSWTQPQNVGYPLNTTDDDLFFHPVSDGSQGYMALFKKDTNGKNDIYKILIK